MVSCTNPSFAFSRPLERRRVPRHLYRCGKDPVKDQQVFNNVLQKINKELAYVQFELRACPNQYDGKVYYGVVNNVSDEQSKLGTKYSVPQISLFKGVIEAIVQDVSNQGCISGFEALNVRLENQVLSGQSSQDSQSHISHAFRIFSMSQKEKTLSDFIKDGWLCNTANGQIGLGIRSFLDLRSWFCSNDIPFCDVCSEAGVKVSFCPNEECNIRIHQYCLKNIFSKKRDSRNCPGCGTEWYLPDFDEDDINVPDQATRKRLRCVKAEAVEANEDHTEMQSQAPVASQPRKRLSGCRADTIENEVQPQDLLHSVRKRPSRCVTESAEVADLSGIYDNRRRTRPSYRS